MAFARPFFLILLVALVYFAYLGRPTGRYGRGRGWAALALRCLIVLFTVLGLAGTQSVRGGDELSTVFLVDVSDSIPNAEQDRALAFVEESLAAIRAKDRAAVVLFGADALVERPMIGGGELGQVSSVPHTHQTDLEGAIQLGMALFPAGSSRRLVLLSDGRPTLGEAEQAVRLAHAQSIQLDVVGLSLPVPQAGQGLDEAWLSELTIPDLVHQGEEFTLNVTARATIDMEAVLTVLGGERILSRQILHLNPGSNTFAVPLSINETGFTSFRAHLAPTVDTSPQNNGLPIQWSRGHRACWSSQRAKSGRRNRISKTRCGRQDWKWRRVPRAHSSLTLRRWLSMGLSCWWTRPRRRSLPVL